MNIFGSKIKTEYEYEYYSVFEKHRIIRFSNIFGPNYSNMFEYRIIRSPLTGQSHISKVRVIVLYEVSKCTFEVVLKIISLETVQGGTNYFTFLFLLSK